MALPGKDIRWRALLAESVAVVLSILLAFAIDAWWAERQDREQTLLLLDEVLQDLYTGKAFIDYNRQYTAARIDALSVLLNVEQEDYESISDEEGYRLAGYGGWIVETNVMPLGPVNQLVSSGLLTDIDSPGLRRALSNLPGRVDVANLYLKAEYDFAYETWLPYMVRRANLMQLDIHGDRFIPGHPSDPWPTIMAPVGDPVPISDLLKDREFRNLLLLSLETLNSSMEYFDWIEEFIDEAIGLIQAEIEG